LHMMQVAKTEEGGKYKEYNAGEKLIPVIF
jgi:hypothetical protein